MCSGPDLNWRHLPLQGSALPTELPEQDYFTLPKHIIFSNLACPPKQLPEQDYFILPKHIIFSNLACPPIFYSFNDFIKS